MEESQNSASCRVVCLCPPVADLRGALGKRERFVLAQSQIVQIERARAVSSRLDSGLGGKGSGRKSSCWRR